MQLADIAAAPLILIAPTAVACGLPVLTHHMRVQSPRHGETGEKDISMVLVGDDLRRERVPDVLIARNESHRRCYGEVIEDPTPLSSESFAVLAVSSFMSSFRSLLNSL